MDPSAIPEVRRAGLKTRGYSIHTYQNIRHFLEAKILPDDNDNVRY